LNVLARNLIYRGAGIGKAEGSKGLCRAAADEGGFVHAPRHHRKQPQKENLLSQIEVLHHSAAMAANVTFDEAAMHACVGWLMDRKRQRAVSQTIKNAINLGSLVKESIKS